MTVSLLNPYRFGAASTFPIVAATNNGIQATDTTSHTVNLPSGIVSGQLLIAAIAVDGNATLTWPAGWTQLLNQLNGTACRLAIRYRFADGSEGASITVTSSNAQQSAHLTWRITQAHASTAPEATAQAPAASTSPNSPNLDPAGWASENTLWLTVEGNDDGTVTVSAYPTNYTGTLTATTATSDGVTIGAGQRDLAASAEDPGAFTISSSVAWVAATVAVRPAA